MSTTTTPAATLAATNEAVAVAKGLAEAISAFETANPALYAQLVGSLGTYGKSAAAPVIGLIVGAEVARLGLACGAAVTTGCWSADTVQTVTLVCCAAFSAAGAALMHWMSKSPARAVLNASAPADATSKPAA